MIVPARPERQGWELKSRRALELEGFCGCCDDLLNCVNVHSLLRGNLARGKGARARS